MGTTSSNSADGVMSPSLQNKLSKSLFNLKVVIRGDKGTGKSALFIRLQGGNFIKEHIHSFEIQSCHISWSYKTTEETAIIEVWDLPDNYIETSQQPLRADSSSIQPYHNANLIIFLLDPQRRSSFDYIKKELKKVPSVDIIILFNFCDLKQYHTVSVNEVHQFLSNYSSMSISVIEISLKDNYGLRELYSYINIPFLRLKERSLEKLLQQTHKELKDSQSEIEILLDEQDYERWLKNCEMTPKGKRTSIPSMNTKEINDSIVKSAPHTVIEHNNTNSSSQTPVIHPTPSNVNIQNDNSSHKSSKSQPSINIKDTLDNFNIGEDMGQLEDSFFSDDNLPYDETIVDEPKEKIKPKKAFLVYEDIG